MSRKWQESHIIISLRRARQVIVAHSAHSGLSLTALCLLFIAPVPPCTQVPSVRVSRFPPVSSPHLTESGVLQLKLKALILDVIHNIGVLKQLRQAGVTGADAWAWKKQLRFYMRADRCCVIHMVDAQFSYTYEYQVCQGLSCRPSGESAPYNFPLYIFCLCGMKTKKHIFAQCC